MPGLYRPSFDKTKPSFEKSAAKALSLIILPLLALLIYSNFYSINVSNRLIARSNQSRVNQWADQIDLSLEVVERYLAETVYGGEEFQTFGKGENQLNVYLSTYAIRQRMDTAINVFSVLGGILLYSQADRAWAESFAEGAFDYVTREGIRQAVRTREDWSDNLGTWQVFEAEGRKMLALIYGKDEAFMVAISDFPRMMDTGGEPYTVFFTASKESEVLSRVDWVTSNEILSPLKDEDYRFAGAGDRYMVVAKTLSRAPVRVVLAVSNAGYWSSLTPLQNALLFVSLFMVLSIPLVIWWTRRYLGRPLRDLSRAMDRIKSGELTTQITHEFYMGELEEFKRTFNDMMSQIHTLKIEAYDREIDRQRIQMQYLQLQLRPHFFINCLTNVNACVRRQRYEQVQELIMSISDYIRYLFRNNLRTVSLREELRFVTDYINIQQMSLALPPVCEIIADDDLMEFHIPPFSIESFVENAVKHQRNPEQQLEITVRAMLLDSEDGQFLDVIVRDNGTGFPEDTLKIINSLSANPDSERHVGLNNLRQRLALIYGEKATLAFYNETGGAVSEVICPALLAVAEAEI